MVEQVAIGAWLPSVNNSLGHLGYAYTARVFVAVAVGQFDPFGLASTDAHCSAMQIRIGHTYDTFCAIYFHRGQAMSIGHIETHHHSSDRCAAKVQHAGNMGGRFYGNAPALVGTVPDNAL